MGPSSAGRTNAGASCPWPCLLADSTLLIPACPLQVLSWGPEVHAADAVLSALHSLLSELSALDFARQDAAAAVATGTSGRRNGRPVIDTTPLREALNALPGQEFKIGGWGCAGAPLHAQQGQKARAMCCWHLFSPLMSACS